MSKFDGYKIDDTVMIFKMSRKSTAELLEYTRLTLRLIEQHPHRDEDAHLACELTISLKRYIAELGEIDH